MPERQSTHQRSAATARSRRGRFPAPSIAAAITRTELRRMARGMRANDYFLLGAAIIGIPSALGLFGAFAIARDASAELAGDPAALDSVTTLLAGGWLFVVGFHLFTAAGEAGDVENEAGILTVRPPKDVAGGLLGVWTAYYTGFVLLPVLSGFLGIAVGIGSPLPPIGGLLAGCVVGVTAASIGFPLGLAAKGLLRRYSDVQWLKPVIGLVVGIAYFWIMFTGRWLDLLQAIDPALQAPPLGWIGDLALATTPGAEASVLGAVGAVAIAAAVAPIGALATVRAAEYAWSADREHASDGEAEAPNHGGAATDDDAVGTAEHGASVESVDPGGLPVAPLLDVVCRRPGTRGVAEVVLLRSYRRPMLLVYALWPLLLAIPMVDQLTASGSLPWYAPWFAVLVGAWIAGETVPLNVLGNQGATLPALLTSKAGGREIVNGHVVAVALPLAPLTAGLAVATGVLAGAPPLELAVLAVAGVGAVCASAVLAAGLGAVFPSFSTLTIGSSNEVSVPSKRAFAGFSTAISLTTTGTALAIDETARLFASALLSEHVPFVSPSPGQLETVGFLLLGAVVVAVPAAYVVAVRRIDGYRMD